MGSPRIFDIYLACPAYAGNGGYQAMHPDVTDWLLEVTGKMRSDPRIGHVHFDHESDTPVTMIRNDYVLKARKAGAEFLLMVDSDQSPNKHKTEPWFKPFWETSFEYALQHYDKGPLVIGAPYCGPPGDVGENVYVFHFENFGVHGDETNFKLEQYPRAMAAQLTGIQECAALPTGMILIDMRIFEMIEPSQKSKRQVLEEFKDGKIDIATALREITEGWFYYEWENGYAAKKASTEDVTFTRDVAIAGMHKLGYNPLRCNWDCWIGHHKPYNVGKPRPYGVEHVGNVLMRAAQEGANYTEEKLVQFEASPKTLRLLGLP